MEQVNREPLSREQAGELLHAGDAASSAVERDDGRNRGVRCLGQVRVEADGLAAALENSRRLYDLGHQRVWKRVRRLGHAIRDAASRVSTSEFLGSGAPTGSETSHTAHGLCRV